MSEMEQLYNGCGFSLKGLFAFCVIPLSVFSGKGGLCWPD